MRTLADEGIAAVRIDRIAPRVGLSKGSFFHHFSSAAGYRAALLDAWRTRAMEQVQDTTAVRDLTDLAIEGDVLDVRLERSIRAWASHDAAAASALEAVDTARLTALQGAWSEAVADPARAKAAALLPHLVVIGASVARPTPTDDELDAVLRLLAELVPAVLDS